MRTNRSRGVGEDSIAGRQSRAAVADAVLAMHSNRTASAISGAFTLAPGLIRLAPLVRRHGMVGEGEVPVASSRIPAGLAEQHLDQVPVHAAVIFPNSVDERLDVEPHTSAARHAIDRETRSGL